LSHGEKTKITLSFENGEIQRIATHLKMSLKDVDKAFRNAEDADDFVSKLNVDKKHNEGLKATFLKIRGEEHTYRAVYRLAILGAVDDYVVDYSGKTITADITPLTTGRYIENLLNYVQRYDPMEVPDYRTMVNICGLGSELRCCIHTLIQFIYNRIAKQRLNALDIMEQTTVDGITNPASFANAVTYFFDSKYLPVLRPHLNVYSPNLVFDICRDKDTVPGSAKIPHLLGACNRLLPENPNNAAFHALRAYAIALSGYRDEFIMEEIQSALDGFVKYFGWGRKEKLAFLTKLRGYIAPINTASAKVFDAAIISDHAGWLKEWNASEGNI